MSDGQTLYDSQGRPVGTVTGNGAPTNGGAPSTTQQVQSVAERGDSPEVVGGTDSIPFGPALTLEQDPVTSGIADPGFAWGWYDGEPRRTFRLAGSVGMMPLLRFAHAAKVGMDSEDLEGMAALYTMIQDTIDPDDWPAFVEYATVSKADDEELMGFVSAAMEVITARPRKRRGNSSATSPRTSPRSKGNSSGPGSAIPPGGIRPPEVDGLMPVADLVR